jgi:prepilin-type N-terminal cleavage/methylation domain-containing protein
MKRNFFTLLELIIVIAIIGILVSILLPSLRGAREKSLAAVCLSNQKQLSRGSILQTKENNGWMIRGAIERNANKAHKYNPYIKSFTAYEISPYLGVAYEDIQYAKNNEPDELTEVFMNNDVYQCPSFDGPDMSTTLSGISLHYLVNATRFEDQWTDWGHDIKEIGGAGKGDNKKADGSPTSGYESKEFLGLAGKPNETALFAEFRPNYFTVTDNRRNSFQNHNITKLEDLPTKYGVPQLEAKARLSNIEDFLHPNRLSTVFIDGHGAVVPMKDSSIINPTFMTSW